MSKKQRVISAQVPESKLLYPQAFKANGILFLAGQGPLDASGALIGKEDFVPRRS